MTDRPTNEEREALIAGDRAGGLEPDEAAELALLADLLADPSTWAEPSAGLEDAIVDAVANAQPTATMPLAPRATGASHEVAPRRRRVVMSAVAAAAAIAIVVVTLVVSQDGASPDYAAQLSATGLAPGAHASADITRTDAGFRVTLDARGLPLLQTGEYYEAWLKDAADTLVPIGTFSSSDGRVTLWSGVSPKDFPTITVTIEALDNDQASSGRRVLVGEVRAT
jgi:Anti-sigma-K factor rskA, C-terminal